MAHSKALKYIIIIVLALSFWGCGEDNNVVVERELKQTSELTAKGDGQGAMTSLLNAQSHIDNNTPLQLKLDVYSWLGAAFYDVHKPEDAKRYFEKAVNAARESDSIDNHPELLWNLVLTISDNDSVKQILSESRDICNKDEKYRYQSIRSEIALSKLSLLDGDIQTAKRTLDSISLFNITDHILNAELLMQKATVDLSSNDFDSSISILDNFSKDSLSIDGNVERYYLLTKSYEGKEDFRRALTYRDSLTTCLDSIQSMRMSESINKIEKDYEDKIKRDKSERKTLLILSSIVVVILLVFVLLINRSRRLKKKQVALVEQIYKLNLKLSSLQDTENTLSDVEKSNALIDKIRLNKELFSSLPLYVLIGQANLERNAEDLTKDRQKELYNAVVAQFSDVCNNLKEAFPLLSSDDMMLGLLTYIGLNKEVISVLLKSSDDALRQRKSRMKKKISPEMFELFFCK